MTPLEALRHHVTGAIERGEGQPIHEAREPISVDVKGLGLVRWRTVARIEIDGKQSILMDGNFTLRAALRVAAVASATYPDDALYVFTGKRIGRWTATYRKGQPEAC